MALAGPWSNTVKVTLPGGTSAPTGKIDPGSATADGLTGVDLSWDRYRPLALPATICGAGTAKPVPGTPSVTIRPGLPTTTMAWSQVTQYWYVIRAVNDGGNGPWSSEGGVGYTSVTLPGTTVRTGAVADPHIPYRNRPLVDSSGRSRRDVRYPAPETYAATQTPVE